MKVMIFKNKNKINLSSLFNASFKSKIIYSFTLVEILVVATIIGLLAAGGIVSYSQFTKQSRDAKRKADLEQIRAALEMYRSNNNVYYPNSTSFNDKCSQINWLSSYLNPIPVDPKSNTHDYRCIVSQNDFTVAAYLEAEVPGCSSTYSCGTNNCNYCLGPYGRK